MPICFHFGIQVEVQKVDGIEFKFKNQCKRFPRGPKSVPREAKTVPRAARERPKSAPRVAKSDPRASKMRSGDAQASSRSARVQPRRENQGGALQKHKKIDKSVKNGQKYRIVEQKRSKVVDMVLKTQGQANG